jgi:hypothetical protein
MLLEYHYRLRRLGFWLVQLFTGIMWTHEGHLDPYDNSSQPMHVPAHRDMVGVLEYHYRYSRLDFWLVQLFMATMYTREGQSG